MNKRQIDNERLKELLSHPVFLMHDTNTKVIRAQLFFLSVVSIILVCSQIKIGEGSSILGIKLKGLTSEHIYILLLLLLVYQLVHFVWASSESFMEWRLRQTALDTGGLGRGGLEIKERDISGEVRQTTIYAFLLNSTQYSLKRLQDNINVLTEENAEKTYKEIENEVKNLEDSINHKRLDEAMWRFDNWFLMFCKFQNWRWLILEFSLPVILAVSGISLLLLKLVTF
ncbi:hypothetical protein [Thiomicrospira sp. S5]|uniref:hypothetical protein n=1 Tax=Thiomicrospira sp. S5 TaxID=1803865 RepID=UPI000F8A0C19|nr:hypothetical protein [Thiomicrospira sp. S5]AZR83007.1 hypothetical protein AYJ59_12425 [Thiomicrospira sp. S5]